MTLSELKNTITEKTPYELALVYNNAERLMEIGKNKKALNEFAAANKIGEFVEHKGLGAYITKFTTFKKALQRIAINYDTLPTK